MTRHSCPVNLRGYVLMQFLCSHSWKAGNDSVETGVLCLLEGQVQPRKLQQEKDLLAAFVHRLLHLPGKTLTRLQIKELEYATGFMTQQQIFFQAWGENIKHRAKGEKKNKPKKLTSSFFDFYYFRILWGHLTILHLALSQPQKKIG